MAYRIGIHAPGREVCQLPATVADHCWLGFVEVGNRDVEVDLGGVGRVGPGRRVPATLAEADRSLGEHGVEVVQVVALFWAAAHDDPELAVPLVGVDG